MPADTDLDDFCRAEHPDLVGFLSLYCGSADVAEELAQDAVARLCRDWHRVRRMDNPKAWLYRVAINLTNSLYRRRAAERRARTRMPVSTEVSVSIDDARAIFVRQIVASLPRRLRSVLVLRFFADLSVRETADLLGIPDGTVKTRTRKALADLRGRPELDLREVSDVV